MTKSRTTHSGSTTAAKVGEQRACMVTVLPQAQPNQLLICTVQELFITVAVGRGNMATPDEPEQLDVTSTAAHESAVPVTVNPWGTWRPPAVVTLTGVTPKITIGITSLHPIWAPGHLETRQP